MKLILLSLFTVLLRGQITSTISDQGSDVIHYTTGQTPKIARLLMVITCNESSDDVTLASGRVYRSIELDSNQISSLYSSEVIDAVLAEMQTKDIFNRLYRGGTAGASIAAIVMTAFKTSPLAATILQVAPPIFQATVGIVHTPRDLVDFGRKILSDNISITLPKNGCLTSLVIARTNKSIATERVKVQ